MLLTCDRCGKFVAERGICRECDEYIESVYGKRKPVESAPSVNRLTREQAEEIIRKTALPHVSYTWQYQKIAAECLGLLLGDCQSVVITDQKGA